MMAPTKMKLRMRKKDASGKASQSMSAEASPDSKCPICLDRFNNMASLDRCLHKFCFRCIHEWSKNKAECPLCKQPFNSIFHTIKAENDFKEFVLRPAENGTLGSPGSPGAVRLRYGASAAALGRERRQSPRRTSPPPDHGIMFEGLTGSAPLQQDRGVQRMMVRLAARRRAQKQGRAVRHLREQEMVTFRRALYRTGVRVRSVRDGGRHRDVSAAFFQRNPACLHRLVPWLKRELTVLYGTHGSLVNIVQHIIMSRVTRYDMDDQAIQDELRPFLLTRTDHFLHELISFARSPFSMEAYDQHAVYDCPAPSYEEGSSSDSSVIAISEDEEDPAELARRPASATGSGLSQAPWDDETPGPSYSTAEQTQSPSLSVSESASESSRGEAGGPQAQPGALVKADPTAKEDRDASSAEEDCMIVGYVKPMAERTPELVQLSSNSEEEESAREEPPQHLRFPSLSPPSSSAGSPAPKRGSPGGPGQGLPRGTPEPAGEDPCASELQRQHGSSDGGDCVAHTDAAFAPTDRPSDEPARETDAGGHGDRSRERSGSGDGGGGGRRSGSAELGCPARSPTISVHSDSTLSRGRVRSQSPSRDRVRERRRDRVAGQPRHGRGEAAAAAYSYHWESYSHYSRESRSGGVLYTQSRAYRSRLYAGPARGPRPRSRSHPREPQHRARARSRSRSPSSTSSQGSRPAPRGSRHDKPGGKRKYKTRHLEESAKGRAPRAPAPPAGPALKDSRGGERRRKRSRRKSRSPSVEIVYEGKATGAARRHQRKRKKHRKRSRRHRSREHRSPTVITIDSDSDRAADASDRVEVSDQTTDAGPFGSENEVSAGTEPPSDAHLLESILQDLQQQQHILPVDQDRAAAGASAGAAAAELSPDYDKCGALRGESGHSCVSSGDEAGADSPVITIGSHFIRQSSLDEAPDASAVCCSD